jgi:hypothetical protein
MSWAVHQSVSDSVCLSLGGPHASDENATDLPEMTSGAGLAYVRVVLAGGTLAAEACARGYKVRFYPATELVRTLIKARDERSFLRLKTKLDLLVLDELGYVPASKVGAELLFDVISTAYERTSMIVTTNLPFESWTEVLGSERLTGATLDRLTHRCRIIETKGESYRLHDAKTRSRRRPNPDSELTLPTSPTN